jgi:hypothetical protein
VDCLPIVDVVGGYVNQEIADYVQRNFGLVGTGNYTRFEWRQRNRVIRERELQMITAHKNVQALQKRLSSTRARRTSPTRRSGRTADC